MSDEQDGAIRAAEKETPRAPRWPLVAGLAAVALLVLAALGVAWAMKRPAPVPPLGARSEAIVRGVYMLRGLGPSVAYAVETSEGPVLIDSGLEADASAVKGEMARFGLDWRSTAAILLTHAHGDHVGGAESLRKATRARVHAGRGDAPIIRAGGPRKAVFSAFYMPKHEGHPTTVDVELSGGEALGFGDTTIRAIGSPGHTPGSICYLLERDGHRILFSGDVVMHLGETTPLGTYSAYLSPGHRGDARTYLATLRELRALSPPPDVVLPGHPPLAPPFNDPRMTPGRWTAMVDAGIRDMETLIARYQADGADFLDDEPKELLKGLFYLGDFQGVAVYALAARGRTVLVNAPGGDGLPGFVEGRLKALKIEPSRPSAVLLTSVDPRESGGLSALVAKTGAEVITSQEGREAARSLSPQGASIFSAEGLGERLPFDLQAVPLRGPGAAPVAYRLSWQGKTILFTGRVPRKMDEEALATLNAGPAPGRSEVIDEMDALRVLEPLKPDLWLPAVPWHGQNANLYDREWDDLIASNYRVDYLRLRRAESAGSAAKPAKGK